MPVIKKEIGRVLVTEMSAIYTFHSRVRRKPVLFRMSVCSDQNFCIHVIWAFNLVFTALLHLLPAIKMHS